MTPGGSPTANYGCIIFRYYHSFDKRVYFDDQLVFAIVSHGTVKLTFLFDVISSDRSYIPTKQTQIRDADTSQRDGSAQKLRADRGTTTSRHDVMKNGNETEMI